MRHIVVVLLVIVVGVAFAGVVGAVAAGGGSATDVKTEAQIDEALQSSNGTVEVVVTVEESETAADIPALRAHASESQEPLMRFAERTPGLVVERQFWLTSAALVTVDTDRVNLETLAGIEGVEALYENVAVSIDRNGPDDAGPAATSDTGIAGDEPGVGPRSAGDARATPRGGGSASDGASRDNLDTTYGLDQINAPEVWEAYDTQGEGTSIAVLDTGADDDHPDIDVAKWAHFDEDGEEVDSEPQDGDGHGTHVSGTATGGDASGTAIGVAPEADLYAVKVLDDDGEGAFSQIIAGMEWAVEEDTDVMTMSLGAEGYVDPFIDPVRNAHDAGTAVVASIGNDGEGTSSSPGNVYDAISVGASDEDEDIADFSSGEEIDTLDDWTSPPPDWPSEYVVPSVAAPGSLVYSAEPGGTWDHRSGTSMAAPHVSGAIALVESAVSPDATPETYEETLEATAHKPDDWDEPEDERDTRYGSGIIDAMATAQAFDDGPTLALASIDHPETVDPDEDLPVEYTIENTGDEAGTESAVELLVEGTDESPDDADEDVTVGAGETETGTLTFTDVDEQFEAGDTISFTVALEDAGDSADGTAEVAGDPAEFAVDIVEAADVVEGEDIEVTAEVENVGDEEDSQEVTLDVESLGGDETEVTLGGGESTEETLAVGTGEGDAGEYTATVASEDDESSTEVTVLEQASFAVDIVDASDAVEGEDIEVTAEVENAGDVEDTQSITLDVPDLGADATELSLDGGESTEETLAVGTGEGDAGEYTATVASEDDEDSTDVTVFAEASFAVDIVETTDVAEGEDVEVTAEITNVGDSEESQEITLDVPDLGEDATEVSLSGGESSEETLAVGTEEGDAGEYTATVASADDEASANVTVHEETGFFVSVLDVTRSIEGEDIGVTAEVTHVGDGIESQTVVLDVPELGSDEQLVTLGGGESTTVEFEVETAVGQAGTYAATVASEDDEATVDVEVLLPTLPGQETHPRDHTGDGLYEDVTGSGEFTIADVQVLFDNLESDAVQNHAPAYQFQAGDDGVTIFDVQALFNRLS